MSALSRDRNVGCRVHDDYVYRGMRVLVLENDLLRISLLLDKGATIYELLYKPLDVDFMFLNNQGVRAPDRLPTSAHSWGFLTDYYDGGWHEQLPNAGAASDHGGTQQGLHGEVCLLPWHAAVLEDSPERVEIRLWVRTYRTPFLLEKTLTLLRGSSVLYMHERLTNESGVPVDCMWGHHPTLGGGFLNANCVIDLPPCDGLTLPAWTPDNRLAPDESFRWPQAPGRDGDPIDLSRVLPAEAHTEDAAYLSSLSEGWWAVTDTRRRLGIGQSWPLDVFPYLILWAVYGGSPGYPWYRQNTCLALEPQSSIPEGLAAAAEAGTALTLGGGQSLDLSLTTVVYTGCERVKGVSLEGEVSAA